MIDGGRHWGKGKSKGGGPTSKYGEHEGAGGLIVVEVEVVVVVEVVVSEVVLEVLLFVGIARVVKGGGIVDGGVVNGPIDKIEMGLVLNQEYSVEARAGVRTVRIK